MVQIIDENTHIKRSQDSVLTEQRCSKWKKETEKSKKKNFGAIWHKWGH